MRIRIKTTSALLLAIAVASTALAAAQAPVQSPAAAAPPLRYELAIGYSYLRSNAPPGGCGCINLNGGSASFAWAVKPGGALALVGDITAAHAGSISGSGESLTLSSYTAGARYRLKLGRAPKPSPWQPFGQVLVGLAHASGTLVEGQNSLTSNAGAAFAANLGGGLDLGVSRRFSLRLIEADYLVTTFDNNVNDHQNNLRLGAGLAVHFGK
jgi:peptidoglycan-associated lipoprotein